MASGTPCARCGKPTEHSYFYYGKETGFQEVHMLARTPAEFVHHYQVGGSEHVALCEMCVERSRAWRVVTDIVQVPLFDFLFLLGGLGAAAELYTGNWMYALGFLGAVLAVALVSFVLNPEKEVGTRMAIELRRKDLLAQGWTHLWTTAEYAKLKPDAGRTWRPRLG